MEIWKMSNVVGVIAEDKSDVAVVNEILGRYFSSSSYSIKKFVGKGCGKVRQKCSSWANNLMKRGCHFILVFHDLDNNDEVKLRKSLYVKLDSVPITEYLVIIPIKELEAWLLSDPAALKKTFSLKKLPKKIANTETIESPKEHLRDLIWRIGKTRYLNTVHNVKISRNISLTNYRRCKSFRPLDKYLMNKK
jgi:hypothetical protein